MCNSWQKSLFYILFFNHRSADRARSSRGHSQRYEKPEIDGKITARRVATIGKLKLQFDNHMKSFIAKRLNSILVNLRYLRFKLLKYKENNKKICNTFDHNFKNIPLYIMRKVSLERYYFVLYDCALTSKISKMTLKSFCDKTLHILLYSRYI